MTHLTDVTGTRSALLACAMAMMIASASCGGGSNPSPESAPEPDVGAGEHTTMAALIQSDAYAGHLVVHFDDALAVRMNESKALTTSTNKAALIASVENAIKRFPESRIVRTVEADADIVDARRAKLERLSGKQLTDWNSIYHIETNSAEDAIALLNELRGMEGVTKVYPGMQGSPSGLAATPALDGLQGYLFPESTHGGLNAHAAWNAGATGEGVTVVDNEHGMNFDHEDLGLIATRHSEGGNFFLYPDCAPGFEPQIPNCESAIAHGTAVAGVMVALNNGHGVTGFAPDAFLLHESGGSYGLINSSTDGIDDPNTILDDDLEPGSIWVIEMQLPGKFADGCSGVYASDQYGCMPRELWPEDFAAIEQATAYGVTVISAAANGSMDFDNPELYSGEEWAFAKDLSVEDSGSILVGASEGANESKISFSNCGSRVNSFSWGQGVVTTGYEYGLYAWNGTQGPIPPNDEINSYFIDNFGGTSSAAAIVGGAAVLVQSYARNDLGYKRYLMPPKMREIIVGSGVNQTDAGCNIGTQPRIDVAMTAVDTFLAQMRAEYPELDSGEILTEERMIALRQAGIGIICKEGDLVNSDPICPDEELFTPQTGFADHYDFDGDGRADLVQWTNGTWKLDLSSIGEAADGFGSWDVEIAHDPIDGRWVWPYVEDVNADGRSDFVVYDKEHGTFYIAFTDVDILRRNEWHGWDWELDYSAQWVDDLKLDPLSCTTRTGPNCSNYSRPALGDYDEDGFMDIAIACSDGIWRVDYGGTDESNFSGYEFEFEYLSDEELAQAPGWAYLAFGHDYSNMTEHSPYFSYKYPDGLVDEGTMVGLTYPNGTFNIMEYANPIYGGNEAIPVPGRFDPDSSWSAPAIKDNTSEKWSVAFVSDYFASFTFLPPDNVYGGGKCHPMAADFDGDGKDDRAVMCPDEWRIAYSGDTFSFLRDGRSLRTIDLEYDADVFTLPGRSYPGGLSYAYVKQVIDFSQQMSPGIPPPIPVDMGDLN